MPPRCARFARRRLSAGDPDGRRRARAQVAPAPAFKPQDQIPFDPAVKTGTLPNGLTYFIRRNARPAKRVVAPARREGRLARRGRRPAGPRALHRAHGVQRQRPLQAGRARLVLRVVRRAPRPARQRVHELRRDRLHARPADRQAGRRGEGADRARRLRRRPHASTRRRSTRSAASSSRSGAAGSAPARACATSRSRSFITTRGTPSGCRSASPTSSARRPPRGCARSTTRGTARTAWRSSPSATSTRPQIASAIGRGLRSAANRALRRSRRPTPRCRCSIRSS